MQLFTPDLHKGAPSDLFGQAKYLYNGIIDTVHLIWTDRKTGNRITSTDELTKRRKTYLKNLKDGNWSFDKDETAFNDLLPANEEILKMLDVEGVSIKKYMPYIRSDPQKIEALNTAFHESKHASQDKNWKTVNEFNIYSHLNGSSNYWSDFNSLEQDAWTFGDSFGKYDKSHMNTNLQPYLEDLKKLSLDEYYTMRGGKKNENGEWIRDPSTGLVELDKNYGEYGKEGQL